MNTRNIPSRLKRKVKNRLNRLIRRLQRIYTAPAKWLYAHRIVSREDLYLPDFLGIGAQRAGTSWLYENLRCHSELCLPDQKELHYFDWEFHKSLSSYSDKFKRGCQKVKGEITPGYSIIPLERIRFIRTIMPDVRLIFIMRNPIDRAWSQALMNLVRLPNRKFEEVDESEFYAHFRADRSVKRGDYQTILNNWLSVFSREQLYIGFFEDISNRPQKLLDEVFDYIGVSQDVDWNSFPYTQVINKNPDHPMQKKYRDILREIYWRDIEVLYERFGGPIAGWRCL
jgi:hypothetical protein